MKKLKLILQLWLIILMLSSCAVKKEYENALSIDSISVYESYLENFPKSKYKLDVEKRLNTMYEERAWREATSQNSLNSYENYLSNFSNGKYVYLAREEIKKIEKENEIYEAWNKAKNENSVAGFEAFVYSYSDSKYIYDAKRRLRKLKDENAWSKAEDVNTIASYNDYLKTYPNGIYRYSANTQITKLEEEKYILPKWEETKSKNTYEAYSDFLDKYSESSYATLAKNQMNKIERNDWNQAKRINSLASYKSYNNKYPKGQYLEISEKRIIDLEVDKIFKGDYGKLPPMNKSSGSYSSKPSLNNIEIYNNTSYNLTIRYSGDESVRVILSPKQRKNIRLPKGNYRITASVDAFNVSNYAGRENLAGGEYTSEYYIRTETYRSR